PISHQDGGGETSRALGVVAGLGATLLVCIGLGVGLGVLGMKLLNDNPLPLVIGILVGIAAGCVGAYRMVMRVYR
ncbi:MAG: AtpZ/AtpI family protein, partial [Candidatus Dormibacteria bacterium]